MNRTIFKFALLALAFTLIGCDSLLNKESASITAFGIKSPQATGTIDETAKTIAVTVPNGTALTALVATFETKATSVKVGDKEQKSGETPNDFTSAVTYTLTAADGSTKDYKVTVKAEAAAASGATLTGTVTLPASVSGKKWFVAVDSDKDDTNGYTATATGTVTGTSYTYTISNLAAGSYYLYSIVDMDSSWGTQATGSMSDRDYIAMFGATSLSSLPTTANVALAASDSLTKDMTAMLFVEGSGGTGSTTVSGTVTLPAAASGKKWFVMLDSNRDGGDGYTAIKTGTVTGTSFTYTLTDIPANNYFVYSIVDMDGSWATASSGPPSAGDYLAYYGVTSSTSIPTTGNLTVPASGSVTADMTAWTYSTSGGGGGTGSTTVTGTVTLPGDATGKSYIVTLQNATGNAGYATGTVSGTSFTYTISNVAAGTYVLMAIVDLDGSGATNMQNILTTNDYYFAYGNSMNVPSFVVPASGTVTQNMTATVYGAAQSTDYIGTWANTTTTTPAEGLSITTTETLMFTASTFETISVSQMTSGGTTSTTISKYRGNITFQATYMVLVATEQDTGSGYTALATPTTVSAFSWSVSNNSLTCVVPMNPPITKVYTKQ